MNKSYLLTLISFIFFNITFADGKIESYKSGLDRTMSFPNTKEYLTISTDLHTHSVFSDGHVWPNIRVAEALLKPPKGDINYPKHNSL